jgi:DNA-binding MarR family transcriptional regulator
MDATLKDALHFLTVSKAFQRTFDGILSEVEADQTIQIPHFIVLHTLNENPEGLQSMEVAEAFGMSRTPKISRILSRMELNGLVSRQVDPNDARVKITSITPKGEDLYNKLSERLENLPARAREDIDLGSRDGAIRFFQEIIPEPEEA